MLFHLIVAAVLPSMILGHEIISCPGGLPAPTAIRIQGCDASPCHVNRGGAVAYQVDFVTPVASASLTLVLESTTFGDTTIVPLPPALSNACNGLYGSTCPVTAGQALTHGATIPVDTEYHDGVASQLRFLINSAAGSPIVCCLVNIVIN